MSRKEYVFPAPIVQTQADRVEIISVSITPAENEVRLRFERRNGDQVVGSDQITVTMAQFDAFVNNAASFPGSGFLGKVIRFFVSNGTLPAGGTIVEL